MKVVKSRAFKDRLKGHKQSVLALYSPYGQNGYLLYSASKDGSVRAWDLAKRQITIKLLLSRMPNQTVSYEPQNFNQQQKDAKEQKKNQQQQKVNISEQLSSATFNENSVFGGFQDGMIIQWILKTGQIKGKFKGHEQRVSGINILESMNFLVSGSTDCTIRIWDMNKRETQVKYKVAGPVNLIRLGNKQIHALVNRNIFYQINVQTNSIIKCIKFSNHSITNFIYYKDNLIFGNIQNKIQSYNLSNFEPTENTKLLPTKIIQGITGWVLQMKINGNFLYCGCDDRRIRIFNLDQLKQVEQLAGHDDGIISIQFADKMLYTGSYDHSIRSWDIKEMILRIRERAMMSWEDLESKKYEVYYGIAFKNKKKKIVKKKK